MDVYNIYVSRVDIFVFGTGKRAWLACVESEKQIGGEKKTNSFDSNME